MLPRREKAEKITAAEAAPVDDEPDDWDKRIIDTGCSAENETLRMCFVDKKDWRLCKAEMAAFRKCWDAHGNIARTGQRNV
ncbi:hypothetical protein FN846DRAFT_909828 [Sphaerosporella brunnea]|uniref:CHCH domain-containing protein n=1 Tax=Sphaerosporella brunnea TaxID=1250544 RepID=A0A5J5END4_9PEZI|nr:hypothetical protein FN846DRAFT_909828 [Sphaerosporella brunnea]